jgi:chemotaxis protein CheD
MNETKLNIIQGEYAVSAKPNTVISTLLGSCVSVCIFEPHRRAGGMNHFLLPGEDTDAVKGLSVRHGAYLMELLINGLIKLGADKTDMQAKIFGGARLMKGLGDVGQKNIEFARRFLRQENIPLISESTGGTSGRRLLFWPASGRARQAFVASTEEHLPLAPVGSSMVPEGGDLELF